VYLLSDLLVCFSIISSLKYNREREYGFSNCYFSCKTMIEQSGKFSQFMSSSGVYYSQCEDICRILQAIVQILTNINEQWLQCSTPKFSENVILITLLGHTKYHFKLPVVRCHFSLM